jgi:thymidylate synthase
MQHTNLRENLGLPRSIDSLIQRLRLAIREDGIEIQDNRLNRTTCSIVGESINLRGVILDEIKKGELTDKYKDDSKRMGPSLLNAIEQIKKDPKSRRAVILNTQRFYDVFPCFLSIHILYNGRDYTAIVTQRAQDLEKMEKDLKFFGQLFFVFETETGKSISEIIINYGTIHFTKEE